MMSKNMGPNGAQRMGFDDRLKMQSVDSVFSESTDHPLRGRRLYIPRMGIEAAMTMSAAFRSIGIDAEPLPESDDETLMLAGRFTNGEECLPQRVTLGNCLKKVLSEGFDPEKTAFIMPTSSGPCRFGQFAPLMKKIFRDMGFPGIVVFSPTSSDGYSGISNHIIRFQRTAWRAIVVADALRKLLLMFRPYASDPGAAERCFRTALDCVCGILAGSFDRGKDQMAFLQGCLEEARDRFLGLPLKEQPGTRCLVGVIGEIFLRLDPFSNQDTVRKIEALGGEAWMADISEWVWYTDSEQKRKLKERGRGIGPEAVRALIKTWIQKEDETGLLKPLEQLFRNRQEERVEDLLKHSRPYLPARMALGEMTLNTGKAISFFRAGCDGVVDLSPFTCMNGIVTEVIYPKVSEDHDRFPLRIFYFDGVPFDIERDLEIFMDRVCEYRSRKNGT